MKRDSDGDRAGDMCAGRAGEPVTNLISCLGYAIYVRRHPELGSGPPLAVFEGNLDRGDAGGFGSVSRSRG